MSHRIYVEFLWPSLTLSSTWAWVNTNTFGWVFCRYLPLSAFLSGCLYSISTGKVSDGSCRSHFRRLGQLFISGVVFPPLCFRRWWSPCASIYPLRMSLPHPAHASATHGQQPAPLHSAPPSSRTGSPLCPAKKWPKHVWLSPRGDVLFNIDFAIVMLVTSWQTSGVSPVALGVVNYWVGQSNIREK